MILEFKSIKLMEKIFDGTRYRVSSTLFIEEGRRYFSC